MWFTLGKGESNIKRGSISTTAVVATLGLASINANAGVTFGAPIGIDFNGPVGGANFVFSNRWVELTDTGVDINPNGNGTTFNPGDVHTFQSQHRVGSFLDAGGNPLPFPTVPFGPYQITQTIVFNDKVKTFTPNGLGGGTVEFEFQPDSFTNMQIWLDDTTDGSLANPTVVQCYGIATGGAATCPNPDGVLIMEFNLVSNTSSFTASTLPGVGTGQFDLDFQLTFFDPLYVSVGSPAITDLRFTGTLAQPLGATPAPNTMWNGTTWALGAASPNQIFKIDGSKDFGSVPEPATLALSASALLD